MIHRFFLPLLVVVLSTASVRAQQDRSPFPEAQAEFLSDLEKRFNATKDRDMGDLAKAFVEAVETGRIGSGGVDAVIEISNLVFERGGGVRPHIVELVRTILIMNRPENALDKPGFTGQWYAVTTEFVTTLERGQTRDLIDYLRFTSDFYASKSIYTSQSHSWQIDGGDYDLVMGSDGPMLETGTVRIIGRGRGDSLAIERTAGRFDILDGTWSGTSGITRWGRTGLNGQDVFAGYDAYEIDVEKTEFSTQAMLTYHGYFDHPIPGRLTDRILSNYDPETAKYPRFTGDRDELPPQQLAQNVTYRGGFALYGHDIVGATGSRAELTIRYPNSSETAIRVLSENFLIDQPEKVSASDARLAIYIDGDSITHPSVQVEYKLQAKTIKILKGEGALAKTKFSSTYHEMDFQADVLLWDITQPEIEIAAISQSGARGAVFESQAFYNPRVTAEIQGLASYDPLSELRIHSEKTGLKTFAAARAAELFSPNLTIAQIRPTLYKMVREGLIQYDDEYEEITILPKLEHYVMSRAKAKDFDNIRIESKTPDVNARLDLTDRSLQVDGVNAVPLSAANYTILRPDSQQVEVLGDRDMRWDGLFFAARLDMVGEDHYFSYDSFKIRMNQVDTMYMNIPDGEATDAYGDPLLMPIASTLENVRGDIQINLPINKSNRADLPQFPILTVTNFPRVHYDAEDIQNGVYDREDFFFEARPFILDSLNFLDVRTLSFDGTLHSADIFEPIDKPLRLMDDLSLGFNLSTDADGRPVYGGAGSFVNDLTLNNDGLIGSGLINYLTVTFSSTEILFHPDSMKAISDTFHIQGIASGIQSPTTLGAGADITWYPYEDDMVAKSSEENPFQLYDAKIPMEGELSISSETGVTGAGTVDWDEAELTSDQFVFRTTELLADTASLQIKGIDGSKVTFRTPNVNAYVNFAENTGEFKSNTRDISTDFSYNQYTTGINEFFWDIDEKELVFSAPEGSDGDWFVSTNPDQDSLHFKVKTADYGLESSIIHAHGVPEVRVADALIIPDDGDVTILPGGRIKTLTDAELICDTANRQHRITDATLDLAGRFDVRGEGTYDYEVKGLDVQPLTMTDIEVYTDTVGGRRDRQEVHHVRGRGVVTEGEGFEVYPNTLFHGEAALFSTKDFLEFDGYTKIDFKSTHVLSDWFQVRSTIDPDNLSLDVREATNESGQPITTAIFVSKTGIDPMFTEIMNNRFAAVDIPLLEAKGIIHHDQETNTYTFGDRARILEDARTGNILRFDDDESEVFGAGRLDLGLAFPALEDAAAGTVEADLDENEYVFNATIALPLGLSEEIMDRMGYYLFEDNFDMNDIDYGDEDIMRQWAELVDEKTLGKMEEEIATTGFFEVPKGFEYNLVLTDVDLVYDNVERAYRTTSKKMGLAIVGPRGVHKEVKGYLEMGHRMGGDFFNLFLETSLDDYISIGLQGPTMEVVSTLDDINSMVAATDPKKRRIEGENERFYTYIPGNQYKAEAFEARMKEYLKQLREAASQEDDE